MPYKSKRQMRKFFAMEADGELPEGTARQWAHHTKDIKKLSEKVALLKAANALATELADDKTASVDAAPDGTMLKTALSPWLRQLFGNQGVKMLGQTRRLAGRARQALNKDIVPNKGSREFVRTGPGDGAFYYRDHPPLSKTMDRARVALPLLGATGIGMGSAYNTFGQDPINQAETEGRELDHKLKVIEGNRQLRQPPKNGVSEWYRPGWEPDGEARRAYEASHPESRAKSQSPPESPPTQEESVSGAGNEASVDNPRPDGPDPWDNSSPSSTPSPSSKTLSNIDRGMLAGGVGAAAGAGLGALVGGKKRRLTGALVGGGLGLGTGVLLNHLATKTALLKAANSLQQGQLEMLRQQRVQAQQRIAAAAKPPIPPPPEPGQQKPESMQALGPNVLSGKLGNGPGTGFGSGTQVGGGIKVAKLKEGRMKTAEDNISTPALLALLGLGGAAVGGAVPGSIIGGGLGSVAGAARGNTPEGVGRGVIRGGLTGAGVNLGGLLGMLAGGAASDSPSAVPLGALIGAGAGGLGGYSLGGYMLGKPEGSAKRPQHHVIKQAACDPFEKTAAPGMVQPPKPPQAATPPQPAAPPQAAKPARPVSPARQRVLAARKDMLAGADRLVNNSMARITPGTPEWFDANGKSSQTVPPAASQVDTTGLEHLPPEMVNQYRANVSAGRTSMTPQQALAYYNSNYRGNRRIDAGQQIAKAPGAAVSGAAPPINTAAAAPTQMQAANSLMGPSAQARVTRPTASAATSF